MGTPDFILRLRRHVGHELLWLAGATAVIVRPAAGGHDNDESGGSKATGETISAGDPQQPPRVERIGPGDGPHIHPRYLDCEVLLVCRGDNRAWTPITGIVDPGEHPAEAAIRESAEEAGVEIRVLRLAQVGVTKEKVFDNGDRTQFIDHTFECEWLGGVARVADEENVDVRWVPVRHLAAWPGIPPHMHARIAAALSGQAAAWW